MEDVEIGDTVGWRFHLWHGEDQVEVTGEVVGVDGQFVCIRSGHVNSSTCNPFHGRHRNQCHMVRKKNQPTAIAAE